MEMIVVIVSAILIAATAGIYQLATRLQKRR
jgi:hypothetical protein